MIKYIYFWLFVVALTYILKFKDFKLFKKTLITQKFDYDTYMLQLK